MNFEKLIVFFSSISFVIGILLLIHFSHISQTQKLTPSNINETLIGKKISITGRIVNIVKKDKVNYLTISDGIKNFTITIFPDVFKLIENKISIGNIVEISGILSTYKGNLQIILQNPKNLKVIE